jgi:hypothetical protein
VFWHFGKIVELLPGENSLAVWFSTRQLTRCCPDSQDDGLGFETFFFSGGVGCNDKVVAVEPTGAVNDSHAGIVKVLKHVARLGFGDFAKAAVNSAEVDFNLRGDCLAVGRKTNAKLGSLGNRLGRVGSGDQSL